MTTREKIYKRLGLEVGRLKSESGSDWQRALSEIEEEEKEFNNSSILKFNISEVMNSGIKEMLCEKIEVSKQDNLTKYEIDYLFMSNDKDVILNLIRKNYLSDEQKEQVLKNGTWLCKKEIEKQWLNPLKS